MTFTCENCGKSGFKTEKGMKQHQRTSQLCVSLTPEDAAQLGKRNAPSDPDEGGTGRQTRSKSRHAAGTVATAEDSVATAEDPVAGAEDPVLHHQVPGSESGQLDLNESQVGLGEDDSDEELLDLMDDGDGGNEEEQEGVDNYTLAKFKAYCAYAQQNFCEYDENEEAAIKSMQVLRKKKATLDTYDAVMEWHLRTTGVLQEQQTLGDACQYLIRQKMMKKLADRYNVAPIQVRSIVLPSSQARVKIIWSDAKDNVVFAH